MKMKSKMLLKFQMRTCKDSEETWVAWVACQVWVALVVQVAWIWLSFNK